jgi:hypothetical protein
MTTRARARMRTANKLCRVLVWDFLYLLYTNLVASLMVAVP